MVMPCFQNLTLIKDKLSVFGFRLRFSYPLSLHHRSKRVARKTSLSLSLFGIHPRRRVPNRPAADVAAAVAVLADIKGHLKG